MTLITYIHNEDDWEGIPRLLWDYWEGNGPQAGVQVFLSLSLSLYSSSCIPKRNGVTNGMIWYGVE